jgi:hypothetical protein
MSSIDLLTNLCPNLNNMFGGLTVVMHHLLTMLVQLKSNDEKGMQLFEKLSLLR